MALFTDGPVSSMEDLTAQDTQLTERGERRGDRRDAEAGVWRRRNWRWNSTALLHGQREPGRRFWLAPQADDQNVVVTPAAEALAHIPDVGNGVPGRLQQPTERPIRGQARPVQQLAEWAYEKLIERGSGSYATRFRRRPRRA